VICVFFVFFQNMGLRIYTYFSSPLSSVAVVWIQSTVLCLRSLIFLNKKHNGIPDLIVYVVFQRPCVVRRITVLLVHRWEGEVVSSELYLKCPYLILRFGAYEIVFKYFRKHCYLFVFISALNLGKNFYLQRCVNFQFICYILL